MSELHVLAENRGIGMKREDLLLFYLGDSLIGRRYNIVISGRRILMSLYIMYNLGIPEDAVEVCLACQIDFRDVYPDTFPLWNIYRFLAVVTCS